MIDVGGENALLSAAPVSTQADWQAQLRNLAAGRRHLLSRFAGQCSPTQKSGPGSWRLFTAASRWGAWA
jgi:hypothetical protein